VLLSLGSLLARHSRGTAALYPHSIWSYLKRHLYHAALSAWGFEDSKWTLLNCLIFARISRSSNSLVWLGRKGRVVTYSSWSNWERGGDTFEEARFHVVNGTSSEEGIVVVLHTLERWVFTGFLVVVHYFVVVYSPLFLNFSINLISVLLSRILLSDGVWCSFFIWLLRSCKEWASAVYPWRISVKYTIDAQNSSILIS
jgi:hypothetical protein